MAARQQIYLILRRELLFRKWLSSKLNFRWRFAPWKWNLEYFEAIELLLIDGTYEERMSASSWIDWSVADVAPNLLATASSGWVRVPSAAMDPRSQQRDVSLTYHHHHLLSLWGSARRAKAQLILFVCTHYNVMNCMPQRRLWVMDDVIEVVAFTSDDNGPSEGLQVLELTTSVTPLQSRIHIRMHQLGLSHIGVNQLSSPRSTILLCQFFIIRVWVICSREYSPPRPTLKVSSLCTFNPIRRT